MILDQYTAILSDIETCLNDIRSGKEDVSISELTIKQVTTNRDRLFTEKDEAIASSRKEVLDSEIRAQRQPLETKKNAMLLELHQIEAERDSAMQAIKDSNYNLTRKDSFVLINECLRLVDELKPSFADLLDDTITNSVRSQIESVQLSDAFLNTLKTKVEISRNMKRGISKSPFLTMAADKLLLPEVKEGKTGSAIIRILGLTAKVGVLLVGLTFFPVGIVIPYSLFVYKGVHTQTANTAKIQTLLYPYELLKICTERYRDILLEECEDEKRKDLEESQETFEAKCEKVQEDIAKLDEAIGSVDASVRRSIDEERINATVDAKYSSKVAEAEQTISVNKHAFEESQIKLKSAEQKLQSLAVKKTAMKKEIEATLIDLSSAGTSMLLPESFFLGFDEGDNIISLDYGGDASLIMFSGDDTSAVTSFINMIIIQYYTNMMLNNLHLDIIDLENAGIPYDVFRVDKLVDIVSIIASEDDQNALIDTLSQEMRIRSNRISTVAQNIKDYNNIMLERESIPMDYRVVIIQSASEDLLRNPKFLQLCRQGSTNGIVPLIFINISRLPKRDRKRGGMNKDEIEYWANLVKAVPKEFFNYNSETGEVTEVGIEFKQDCLKSLQQALKEAQ